MQDLNLLYHRPRHQEMKPICLLLWLLVTNYNLFGLNAFGGKKL